MTNLIALAVAPLKPIQMDRAEEMVRSAFAHAQELMSKGDGTKKGAIAAVAAEYEAKGWKLFDDTKQSISKKIGRFYRTDYSQQGAPLVACPKALAWEISSARQAASDSYDAYVAKMISKVGEVTKANMQTASHVWGYSVLEVTTITGDEQIWTTQQIVNCSVHGKLFNQWPTRLAASKASQKKALKNLRAAA
jgi:hypothetical protein